MNSEKYLDSGTTKNQPGKIYSYLIMLGHICCDTNQSIVPFILPFLVTQRGIDYASAAGLMFASSSLSSLIQPLLGMLADKKQRPWLMGAGILITGIGISSIGFLQSYWGIFAAVMFAGFGSAMFHPEGGRMANCVAGAYKGRAMSNFTVGGNLGFVLGPVFGTLAITKFGLGGTAFVLVPTVIVVCLLFILHKKLKEISDNSIRETANEGYVLEKTDDWKSFFRLLVSIFMRSIVQNGIQTFIPLYWVGVLMQTQQRSGLMVTVIALAATVTAFTGGRLADRFGFRRVIQLSFIGVAPMIVLMLKTRNILLASVIVVFIVAMNQMGHSPSVVLGQKYLPNRVGLASGVTIGLAVSIGGICSPILGKIGDNYGLSSAMYVISIVGMLGFLGTLLIKRTSKEDELID